MNLKVIGTEKIGGYEFTGIEGGFGEGKRALLIKDVADIHDTDVRTINQTINRNRKRFKDNIDIIDLKGKVTESDLVEKYSFEIHSIRMSNNIYILSERGYAKLLKILEDDTAWDIYDELVDGYFNMRSEQFKLPTDPMDILALTFKAQKNTNLRVAKIETDVKGLKDLKKLEPGEYNYLGTAVSNKIFSVLEELALNKKTQAPLRKELSKNINELAGVRTRTQIKQKDFDKLLDFIDRWQPSTITVDKAKEIQLKLELDEEGAE
ncbi:ORF6C domain-containing protein [Vagococcus carniphilus]|uniref:ORF6N domain-containing protein n=1 Tax=Vagococcus carniphilus TaxID=218144 RepID=UPI0028916778|nr:ORF6C domain-containing protein [Vagococcus carniphilus]MDT2814331.1 ORF6C domain-containing protein [Vagococcus carniphilus]